MAMALGLFNHSIISSQISTAVGGGFAAVTIPKLGFFIKVPEPVLDSSRFLRLHNQLLRSAIRTVMLEHHQNTLPEHFKSGAKSKYNYQERTEATKRIKLAKYHHDIDLVGRGNTRRSMLNSYPRIRITGNSSGIMTGTMSYFFPFPISADAKDSRHVTMEKMGDEIARLTENEKFKVANRIAEIYAEDLRHELASRPKMLAAAVEAGYQP